MISTQKTLSHMQLEILRKRMPLTEAQKEEFGRLCTGYEGEKFLINYLQNHLSSAPVILSNLRFKIKHSECQIDCLLIYQNECILIEVKNYRSDFYIENNRWYIARNNKEIRNPMEQANGARRMLIELFNEEGIHMNVKTFVVFTNPKFLLYNAPRNNDVVYPNRLDQFLSFLDRHSDCLNDRHYVIKEKLCNRNIKVSSFDLPVEFNPENFRQGITCRDLDCFGYMEIAGKKILECSSCAKKEAFESAILRSIYEFNRLFREDKITVKQLLDWTSSTISRNTLQRTLSSHFVKVGTTRGVYYLI